MVDEVARAVQLDRIEGRLKNIEHSSSATHRTMEVLAGRVGIQNHRLDKVEWEQQQAKMAAGIKAVADERTWANARWMVSIMFVAAGLFSGIVFGVVDILSR